MDALKLGLDVVRHGTSRLIDGIIFTSCAFVKPAKSSSLSKIGALDDALIVASELIRSQQSSGKLLIFTNASGIAEDGGWTGVAVKHENELVSWTFYAGDDDFHLVFDRKSYSAEIDRIVADIAGLPEEIELEPCQVVFPEDWHAQ